MFLSFINYLAFLEFRKNLFFCIGPIFECVWSLKAFSFRILNS